MCFRVSYESEWSGQRKMQIKFSTVRRNKDKRRKRKLGSHNDKGGTENTSNKGG